MDCIVHGVTKSRHNWAFSLCFSGEHGHVNVCVYRLLWAQEGFKQPICWWMTLRACCFGCLAQGIGCLVSNRAYRLLYGARSWHQNSSFQDSSHQWILSSTSATNVSSPQWATLQETFLQDQLVGLVQTPMKLLLFPLSPSVHKTLYVICRNRVPVSLLWSSCNQALLAFKAKYSGGPSSQCQTPRLGSLRWGPVLSLLWENPCNTIIFQFVGCLPGRNGVWLYHECSPSAVLLWLLLCLWK